MSPRPGGEADKFGNRYEGAWTVRHLLYVLYGRIDSITVEEIDDLGEGAEFTVRRGDTIAVHQLKRQNGAANSWTPKSLNAMGVWGKIRAHVEGDRRFHFVSMVPARPLQELTDKARQSADLTSFVDEWLPKKLEEPFNELASTAVLGSPEVAWRVLRGIWIECHDERDIIEVNATLAELLLEGASGRLAAVGLGDLALHNLGVRLDVTTIERELRDYGLRRAQLLRSPAIADKLANITALWKADVGRELLQPVIKRSEARDLLDVLSRDDPLVFLLGSAGGGKSAVLHEVVAELADDSTAVLALRIDRLAPFSSTTEFGQRFGLDVSPATALAALAGDRRAVLVVDQVDAVSLVSGHMPRSFDAVADLVREAAAFPNMRLVLACRQFDVENDYRIRELVADKHSTQVSVPELTESQVAEAVRAMGLEPASLMAEQKRLLHTPLHLVLLKSIARPGVTLDFGSARNLFDAFWRRKFLNCSQRKPDVRFAEVLTTVAEAISSRQRRLSVPASILDHDGLLRDADVLVSEHLLVYDGREIAFFHQNFFDYVFARSWVNRHQALVDFLTRHEQELFRRGQVRQILNHLHDDEPERFAEEVEQLLSSSSIRFHIKDVVMAVLRALPSPAAAEWRAVRRVLDTNPPFADRLWDALRTGAWFERLDRDGEIEEWLASADERDHGRALEVMGAAAKQSLDRVAQLLEPHSDRPAFPRWLRWIVIASDLHQSRGLFELVLRAVRRGQYDGAEHDLWLFAHDLGSHQPAWAIELLGAYLIDRPGAMDLESNRVPALLERDSAALELAMAGAVGAPDAFIEILLPYMLRVMALTEYDMANSLRGDHHFSGRHSKTRPYELEEALLIGAASAIRSVAQRDPLAAQPTLERLAADPHEAAQYLLYEGLKQGGDALAQWAADVILEGAHRFLTGSTGNSAWAAREVLQAVGSSISVESFRCLEQAIMDLRFSWEGRQNRGWYSFTLLSALDSSRLSEQGLRRLGELQRFFHMDQPPYPRDPQGGAIGSPIPSHAPQHMTDDDWLRAIAKHNTDRADWETFTGGAHELSQVLQGQVSQSPARFAAFALWLTAETHPAYCSAILRGLGEAEQLTDPGSVFEAIRHIASLGQPANDRWFGSALRRYLKVDVPADVIEVLLDRALHAVDPVDNTLAITSSRPRRPAEDVSNSGINTARGSCAEALGNLLVYDVDGRRTQHVLSALSILATDPSIAVRSCVAHLLAACLRHARPQAVDAFRQLIQADDLLLATHTVESLIMYVGNGDPTIFEAVIWRMLASNVAEAREVGGRLAAFAGMEWGIEGLFDAALAGDVATRKGAAHICTARLPKTSNRTLADKGILQFMSDPDDDVRAKAAEAAGVLRGERLRPFKAVLARLIESPAFPHATPQLLITLERAPDQVDELALQSARRFVALHKAAIGDIRTGAAGDAMHVGQLVVRAYVQAESAATRSAALDLIDELLLVRAHRLDEFVDRAERR